MHLLTPKYYARSVEIPDEAIAFETGFQTQFQTNQAVLGERVKIEELSVWDDLEFNQRAV